MTTVVGFLPPAALLNLNDRIHWRTRSTRNRCWRAMASFAAQSQIKPPRSLGRSLIAVSLPVRAVNQRRDAHNYVATLKPIVDGLVDAGVWPDDNGRWVVTEEPSFHAAKTEPRVIVTITPAGALGYLKTKEPHG